MIITVVTMGVVQVAIDQVVDVIAVRNRFVTATRTMYVIRRMSIAAMLRCAGIGIYRSYLDDMLIHVVFMGMMQVTVMEVVNVVAMLDAGMATIRAMLMGMISVRLAAHDNLPAVSPFKNNRCTAS
ncbi:MULTISPECIES: hypothetical protein [unclassified Cobetia]|uniref:hypothetical protein n=1 Tax=unclassified Cobetia TaxID=2609414 RepID=UPI00209725B6|nr:MULTISPECIES: hypothetical protein [unclassified Cobetia]MCO7233471.1 hypothetical protein [Cobetia sp. Dlab-2-AX]MCO7236747.1 hypothetical protein [Cobetia sp. Dlab-2-U]